MYNRMMLKSRLRLSVEDKRSVSRNDAFLDGYCSTVQGLLDWFEVDLGFTELSFIQIDLCVLCQVTLTSKRTRGEQEHM